MQLSGDGGREGFEAESPETAECVVCWLGCDGLRVVRCRYVSNWKKAHSTAMRVLPMMFSLTYFGNNAVIVKR